VNDLRQVISLGCVVGLAFAATSCSGGDDDDDDDGASDVEVAGDVFGACDKLEVLAFAIEGVRAAETIAEVEAAVAQPLAGYVTAAEASGDDDLVPLAHDAEDAWVAYLAEAAVASDTGDEFDGLIDESLGRCLDLGAQNNFPTAPVG